MEKRLTKEVYIGNRVIGGANPILIQSMTNTKTEDVAATVNQIQKLTNAGCDITGQLAVLLLVVANGNQVGLVQQDIRSHQCRIGKQTAVDILGMLGRLVLELSHTAQLAEHGIAVQNPAQLSVLVNVGLDEEGVLLRVQAAGDVLGQLLQSAAAQVGRVLTDGDGVQVRHKVEAVIFIGTLSPVLHSAEVRTQGHITGRLDAGKHSFLGSCLFHIEYLFCIDIM